MSEDSVSHLPSKVSIFKGQGFPPAFKGQSFPPTFKGQSFPPALKLKGHYFQGSYPEAYTELNVCIVEKHT